MDLKDRIKRIIASALDLTALTRRIDQLPLEVKRVDRGSQLLLGLKYRELAEKGIVLAFGDVEFRNYSQNGEDGILWYVFSLVGTVNKTCVEICAGNGRECNTANLIINHGWTGLLFDGDLDNVETGRRFYRKHPDTFTYPPKFVHGWVTAENVNELVAANGISGEIDLLSLDIDGVDYWIWKAIEAVHPRVVIAEIQAIWGSEVSVTVPYAPDFRAEFIQGFGVYSGASLPAFVKMGRLKGYRLVGVQRYGFNAVFVRNDIGQQWLPEIPAEACFSHPFAKWAFAELRPLVAGRHWETV